MHLKSFIFSAVLILLTGCAIIKPDIKDQTIIDYKLYQGKWYEIARLPNPFEDGIICVTMTYDYLDEGVMTVSSSGRSKTDPGDIKTLTGRAWIPDGKEPRNIKIQFIWPVTKDYTLIYIDETKGYAMIGSPFKHQLWILGRTPRISEEDLAELIKTAGKNQYRAENIVRVEQNCE